MDVHCLKNTDGDGVTDDIDQCENTPFNSNLVSEVGCKIDLFYLSENGLTIKANELAQFGMQEDFNGETFIVVSRSYLDNLIDNEQDLTNVVTSKITDMENLFNGTSKIVGDISRWDTSNVTNMRLMFAGTDTFNQPIGDWYTSNVTDISAMFSFAKIFNQPIGDWDTSNVTNMRLMLITQTILISP